MEHVIGAHTTWSEYCKEEMSVLTPILSRYGYRLHADQPHLHGERYLMQAVTTASGKKLILVGENKEGVPVIIKATRDADGKRELTHERACRTLLSRINFAAHIFHTPEVLHEIEEGGFFIVITRFIPQEKSFLVRETREQFAFALRAFKGQEGAHATTSKHRREVGNIFDIRDGKTYLKNFSSFREKILAKHQSNKMLENRLWEATALLEKHEQIIEQYSGFLTHTDFVPHNFRIMDDTIILLDHSSLTFGNKYEGWARFINFMTLYNPTLEEILIKYVQDNRTTEESIALRMMRIYRLGEIIWYYTRTLGESEGELLTLNTARVTFWSDVLGFVIDDVPVPIHIIEEYKKTRDELRSETERVRQKNLH